MKLEDLSEKEQGIRIMKKLYYKGTHPYGFRYGKWGLVIGTVYTGRWCFVIQYIDGVIDYTPIVDTNNYILEEREIK